MEERGPAPLRESREARGGGGGGAPEAVLQAGMEARRAESTAHTGPSIPGPPPTQDQPEKGEPAPSQACGIPTPMLFQ